jgi:hypothetical protein
MTNQPTTCGQGLADHAALPSKLGELEASLADNLEAHSTALDLSDEKSRQEHDLYLKLVQEHRAIAAQLEAVGEEMAGSKDLPMGRHDLEALSSPKVAEAFERFVKIEQELLTLLERSVERDRNMLAQMRDDG